MAESEKSYTVMVNDKVTTWVSKKPGPVEFIEDELVFEALKELNPNCEHNRRFISWKLGSAQYHCKQCWKNYDYFDIKEKVEQILAKRTQQTG